MYFLLFVDESLFLIKKKKKKRRDLCPLKIYAVVELKQQRLSNAVIKWVVVKCAPNNWYVM